MLRGSDAILQHKHTNKTLGLHLRVRHRGCGSRHAIHKLDGAKTLSVRGARVFILNLTRLPGSQSEQVAGCVQRKGSLKAVCSR